MRGTASKRKRLKSCENPPDVQCALHKHNIRTYASLLEEENKGNRGGIVTEDHRSTCRSPICLLPFWGIGISRYFVCRDSATDMVSYSENCIRTRITNAISSTRTATTPLNLPRSYYSFRQIVRTVFKESFFDQPDDGT